MGACFLDIPNSPFIRIFSTSLPQLLPLSSSRSCCLPLPLYLNILVHVHLVLQVVKLHLPLQRTYCLCALQ